MKKRISFLLSILTVFGLLFIAQQSAFAQGRSGGAGRPAGAGRPEGVGRPTNPGIGTANERSGGRSNTGLGTADTNSNGRSTTGLDRARLGRENAQRADREVSNNPKAAEMLKTNANDLRGQYQAALANNPDLKFGQFVAANMLERNLGSRFPGVTAAALLDGLANGNGFGRTLRDLGVDAGEAKDAERRAKKAVKESRNRD